MRAAFVLASAVVAVSVGVACTSFTADPSASDDDGGVEAGSVAEAGPEIDAKADAGPPPPGPSCREILDQHPERAGLDGPYPLSTDAGPTLAYCDMSVAGGGWTLVGRSAVGASSTDFGWSKKTGDVTKLEYPYSLGVVALGITFGEILVAERNPKGGVGEVAFRFEAKAGFLAAVNASIEIRPVVHVRGPCNPPGGPSMMRYAGATSLNNTFFLRDVAGTDIRNGLRADGWNLTAGDCGRNATLDGKQGVVLVR